MPCVIAGSTGMFGSRLPWQGMKNDSRWRRSSEPSFRLSRPTRHLVAFWTARISSSQHGVDARITYGVEK